jgi:hypothetical protein
LSDASVEGAVQHSGWGGARLRAGRTSDGVSLRQASGIIDAAHFSPRIGLPFNRHIVIHWECAGVPDDEAAVATVRFIGLLRDWIRKRSGRTAWAWVRENGDGERSHVHILLHVPSQLHIGSMGRRWLRRLTGAPYRKGTICTRRIGGTVRAAEISPAVYEANLARVVSYILKGASPEAARTLGIEKRKPGGSIVGKRVATSENVGRAARERLRELGKPEASMEDHREGPVRCAASEASDWKIGF